MAENEQRRPTEHRRGPVRGSEAAKRGGTAAYQKHGREFYARIGKIGGNSLKARNGHEYYARIGKKGGESTRAKMGLEHYAEIGKKGGQHTNAQRANSGNECLDITAC